MLKVKAKLVLRDGEQLHESVIIDIPKEYVNKKYEWKISGNQRVKIVEIADEGQICKVRVYDKCRWITYFYKCILYP